MYIIKRILLYICIIHLMFGNILFAQSAIKNPASTSNQNIQKQKLGKFLLSRSSLKNNSLWQYPANQWNQPLLEGLFKKYYKTQKDTSKWAFKTGCVFDERAWKFYDSQLWDIMTAYALPTEKQKEYLKKLKSPPEIIVPAYAKVLIIANRNNKLNGLSSEQMQQIFRKQKDNPITWNDLGGKGDDVKWYITDSKLWLLKIIISHACMQVPSIKSQAHLRYYCFRDDFDKKQKCENIEEVIKAVARDSDGIAMLLYKPDLEKQLGSVKVLAVGGLKENQQIPVKPILAPVIDENYPLIEPMVIYMHPQAPPYIKDFCKWLFEPEGRAEIEKFGLITPHMEREYLAAKYLKLMKAGEGPNVGMAGSRELEKLSETLVLEYVKANGPIQFNYTDASEMTAVNSFLNRPDISMLILPGKPSEKVMRLCGEKWKELKPQEYLIGGEAVALLVNPANTVDSLTPAQIRGLFSRQIKDWQLIAAKTSANTGKHTVECFGQRYNTPAAQLFLDTVMPSRDIKSMRHRKTTGGVIASVAMDAGAIGFANAAKIPVDDKAIKTLAIGLDKKATLPTPENAINGSYPYSRRFYLFVKPDGPRAVNNLVKYIQSEDAAKTFESQGYFAKPQPKPEPTSKPTTKPAKTGKPTSKPAAKVKKLKAKAATTKPVKSPTSKPAKVVFIRDNLLLAG